MSKICRYFFYLKIELESFDMAGLCDFFRTNPCAYMQFKVFSSCKRNFTIFTSFAFASSPQEALLQIFSNKTKIYKSSVFTEKRELSFKLHKTYQIIYKLIEKLERDLDRSNTTQRIFKPTIYLLNLSKLKKKQLNTYQCLNILYQIRRDLIKKIQTL